MNLPDKSLVALAVLLVTISGLAQAHHSYTGFDRCEKFSVEGVVESIQWANPHVSDNWVRSRPFPVNPRQSCSE